MNNKTINYIKVDLNNIDIAYNMQKNEWPDDKDYFAFEDTAKNGDDKNINFIAYIENNPIGIIGVYQENIDPKSLWLEWFCIDKKYRGKGYGKQMLLDIIEYCKQFDDIDFLRLESNLSIERESTNLYLKVMDFIEKYTIEKSEDYNGYYICTKCLKPNTNYIPWNNRFLGLNEYYNKTKDNQL